MAGSEMPRPRILVVDDERDTRKLVRITLERDGYTVCEAANGEEALALAGAESFDLVILDVMMPRLSGYDVCRQLKERPDTSQIPVIFLSARGQSGEIREGIEAGGVAYIVKPFSIRELTLQVSRVLAGMKSS